MTNLPEPIYPTLTFETAIWSFNFCDLLARRADALEEMGKPRSFIDRAAQYARDYYVDEASRLAREGTYR